MKNLLCALGVALGMVLGATAHADTLTLNFSSIPGGTGSSIHFNGANGAGTTGSFDFVNAVGGPGSGFDFQIDNSNGLLFNALGGDATGLFGNITGNFNIGAISVAGPIQSAAVTGSGTFSISDGVNSLTGTLVFHNITTIGTAGILNLNGDLNVTAISYAGTNVDLSLLAAAQDGNLAINFTLLPPKTLTQLTADDFNGSINSYDGAVTAVPEPTSMALLGIGTLLAGAYRLRRRQS
jgi:hypothetical protein